MAGDRDIHDEIDAERFADEAQAGLREELEKNLKAALEQKLHALVCPLHGPLTGLHIELSEDLQDSEVVGTMCCERGLAVLNAATASSR